MSTPRAPSPSGLRRTFFQVGPATLLVQLASFGSSIALATLLGPSTRTDAYYLALSVPALAYVVLIAAVRLGGIPSLTEIAHTRSPEEFRQACREIVSATTVAAVVLSVVATAVMIVVFPAVGGSARLHSLTREFMLELSPYAVTGALIGVLGGVLAVRGRFAISIVVLLFEPALKTVLLILFHGPLGAQALIAGSVLGNLAAVVVLWGALWRDGVHITPAHFHGSPVVRAVVKISAPLLISQSVLQFNPVIDRAFAAGLGPGSVTVFELGVRLFTAPAVLLAATLTAPLAATWSARFQESGWEAVTASLTRVLLAICLLVPPVVAVGFVLRREVIEFAYSSHAYSALAISHTSAVLGMLLLGLLPQILISPLATLFIVRKETVFPMKVGIANCVLNGLLDYALRGPLGVAGIALSTTLTLTILCGVYFWAADVRWGLGAAARVVWKPATISIASACVIAALSLMIVNVTGPYESRPMQLLAIVCIGTFGFLAQWTALAVGAAYGSGADILGIPGLGRVRLLLGRTHAYLLPIGRGGGS